MRMSRIHRSLFACGLVAGVVVSAMHFLAHDPAERAVVVTADRVHAPRAGQTTTQDAQIAMVPRSVSATSAPDLTDDSLPTYAQEKYAALFEQLFLAPAQVGTLGQLLIARERVAVSLNTARQTANPEIGAHIPEQERALEATEQRLRALLHPTDYATFEVLKDSDTEQFQLDDYASGMSNVAPLSAKDRTALIKVKLRHRQRFRQVLNESGLLRRDLDPATREYAFRTVSAALEEYRAGYLGEARQYLASEEQYALLTNYESTEIDAELVKLRSIANGG
jgi:hypothetical protein